MTSFENEISSFDMAVDLSGPDMREFIRGLGTDFRPSNTEFIPVEQYTESTLSDSTSTFR